MADVTTRHGAPIKADYTPSGGNVNAGQVVLLGNTIDLTCGVAEVAIENGKKGSLAIGGGVYRGINLNNAATNAEVWWDNSAKKFTTVSTNNARFGFVTDDSGGGGANSNCDVLHHPYV
jgi:hypothetical protein